LECGEGSRHAIPSPLERAGHDPLRLVGPALDHATGKELRDRVQMHFSRIISCAETSRLPVVTCRPDNEEETLLREKFPKLRRRQSDALYCGRIKHHAPTSLALRAGGPENAPDLFQTEEWFGSGGEAHRLTLASERFAAMVRERGWHGLEFREARQGFSERIQRRVL
jgi:hypothetical protein